MIKITQVILATALADIKKARELAPTNATIDILEAQLYLAKNNSDEAQKLLFSAIEKKKKGIATTSKLG